MLGNVQSFLDKLDEFVAEISVDSPDVISVTDTWLYSEIVSSEIDIPG